MFKQAHKGSGLFDILCRRYLKKRFTQIYKALYGDAMFVSSWRGTNMVTESYKSYKKPGVIFWGLINI